MTKAIMIREFGGPEVLQLEDIEVSAPGPGEVKIRHAAIGLNFIEIYERTGLYPNPLPFVPGREGAGTVLAVGEGVDGIKTGDRIVYYSTPGSNAEERLVPTSDVVPLPDDIDFDIAAAILLKGLTVNYLLNMTWQLKASDTILFHAAAGGVGLLAMQWARSIGARVIGTVSSAEKAELALANGADEIINVSNEDFVARVRELTNGKGVDVVYDSVGKDTFEGSLDCLRPRGLMVSFGNASGPVAVPNLGILAAKGSLFVTRPRADHYYQNREELLAGADILFEKVRNGTLKIKIGQTFKLSEIGKAHEALAARKTVGSTIIYP